MTSIANVKAVSLAAVGLLMTTFAFSPSAGAGVLTLDQKGAQLEGVQLSKGGTATVGGKPLTLTTVGTGLRSKKVGFIPFKVYVAQLLVTDAGKFVRTEAGALDSVAGMSGAAIQLSFVRSVDSQTMQSAFRDSLAANHADFNSPAVTALLDAFIAGGDATEGSTMTFVMAHQTDGRDNVIFEGANGQDAQVTGPSGWMKTVLSIWLGEPTDSGVSDLKSALISGSN